MLWKMCGIDVHMDPNIGKRLNALGNTLTTLTGEEDVDDIADLNSVNIGDLSDEDEVDTMSPTVHTVSPLTVGHFLTGFYPETRVLLTQCYSLYCSCSLGRKVGSGGSCVSIS